MSGRRHHRRFRRLAPAIGLLAALAWAPAAQAQEAEPPAPTYRPITVHAPVPQERGRWAERSRVAGDLNRDGVNDLWIGVPKFHRDNKPYGRVFALDGASLTDPQGQKDKPKPIYEIRYPEPQPGKNFGFWIENVGDVDGDGTADVAIGTDAQDVPVDQNGNCEQSSDSASQTCDNTQVCQAGGDPKECNENQGKAWVFSGKTNKVLYDLDNPEPQGSPDNPARFGSRIGSAGDVNGNGVPDILVGASGNDSIAGCADSGVAAGACRKDEGRAYIFEGRDGELLRTLKLPEEDKVPTPCQDSCGDLGLAVQGPGDVDGDKVPDLLVSAPSLQTQTGQPFQGRMYVYSGAKNTEVDDRPIRKIDNPTPEPTSFFGFQDATPRNPGDVCGPDGPGKDGKADLYGNGFLQDAGAGEGRSYVFSGATGTLCYQFQNPAPRFGGQFGWSMTRDLNPLFPGEDVDNPATNPIYIGNAPHTLPAPPSDERGETNTFQPNTGAHLQTLPLPPPWNAENGESAFFGSGDNGPALGWNVSSPGDLNRDGFRDFLAGAPFTNVCRVRLGTQNKYLNKDEGVMIVFVSGPPPSGGDENGTPSDKNPQDNVCNDDDGQGGPGE